MATTQWTDQRIEALHRSLDAKFWDGRLSSWVAAAESGTEYLARIDTEQMRIVVCPVAHNSDVDVEQTLLRMMAQVADASGDPASRGFGYWRELERLLSAHAPLRMSRTDLELLGRFASSEMLPVDCPLARAQIDRLIEERDGEINAALGPSTSERLISDDEIVRAFEAAGMSGMSWDHTLGFVGMNHGLLNADREPLNAWAEAVIQRGLDDWREGREMGKPPPS
jgi:hypothetical protein